MGLIISAWIILAIVTWAIVSPRSLGTRFDTTLTLRVLRSTVNLNPFAKAKATRGALVAGIAISQLLSTGIKAAQTATGAFALPFMSIILVRVASLWHAVRENWAEEQRKEKEPCQHIKQMVVR